MRSNKPAQTLVLKVVGFHLLLFVIFFVVIDFLPTHLAMVQVLFLVFILSLGISAYFAFSVSRSIKVISADVDRIAHGDYTITSDRAQSLEIEELSQKVAQLSHVIQSSQDSLEAQHNQLNGILGYMTDGVIATDRRGLVILANTAALHLLHTTTEKIAQQNIAEALSIQNYYAFRDLLERTPDIDIDSENAYGEYVRIKVNFSIFRREGGYISGIVAVLHDVTDAERAERERRIFVSNVSHELRTPLTTIKSYLETLNDGALSDPVLAHDFVATSLQETNHMIRMISDLLDLSRIDQGRLKLNKEIVNLNAFMTHQISRFEQTLKDNDKLKIESFFPEEPLWIELDPDKMGQVMDNIISNAIKYSPDGGTIRLTIRKKDDHATITVEDEGLGIPLADQPKIFDRFFRVDRARNHDQGGTGLGLAIAYDIVKLHGGIIWAKSDGKTGTTMTISLPYKELDFLGENDEWSEKND